MAIATLVRAHKRAIVPVRSAKNANPATDSTHTWRPTITVRLIALIALNHCSSLHRVPAIACARLPSSVNWNLVWICNHHIDTDKLVYMWLARAAIVQNCDCARANKLVANATNQSSSCQSQSINDSAVRRTRIIRRLASVLHESGRQIIAYFSDWFLCLIPIYCPANYKINQRRMDKPLISGRTVLGANQRCLTA